MIDIGQQTFATLAWQKRWNDVEQVASAVDVNPTTVMVVCTFGVMYIDQEDLPVLEHHLRMTADLVKGIRS